VLRAWVGVNNATPDQRPLIGEIEGVPGLVVGTFPYLGFTAGPIMGRLLARLALGRDPELDLTAYAPQRFV
jgi:sarcosine oxidase, subunit beta